MSDRNLQTRRSKTFMTTGLTVQKCNRPIIIETGFVGYLDDHSQGKTYRYHCTDKRPVEDVGEDRSKLVYTVL